jgi:spore photoproduct lyase
MEKTKKRRAALKAWQTIRRRRRQIEEKKVRRLDEIFYAPKRVVSIKHPLNSGLVQAAKPKLAGICTSYGKGIVCQFDKTPPDIACGRFWELRWAFGCPLDCAYCYLRGTSRGNMRPRYVKMEYVLGALDEAFKSIAEPSIFNSGELSDSWMNPKIMIQIIDKFETQRKHKLLTLTKFGSKNPMVSLLLEKPRKQTITAFSINAPKVAEKYERTAPPPEERIEAARLLSEAGYDTRLRIDPIFPIQDWKNHYRDLLYSILSALEPNRIILGTPRGLWKTIMFAMKAGVDMSWTNYFSEEQTGWGKKLPFEVRKEIYQFMYDQLSDFGFEKHRISMCKEEVSMWKELKLNYTPMTCNCYSN